MKWKRCRRKWSWSNLRFSSGTCLERPVMLRIFAFARRFKPDTSGTRALLLETTCRLISSVETSFVLRCQLHDSEEWKQQALSRVGLCCGLKNFVSCVLTSPPNSVADHVVTPSDAHSRAFAKFRRATVRFRHVCLSAWNYWAPT